MFELTAPCNLSLPSRENLLLFEWLGDTKLGCDAEIKNIAVRKHMRIPAFLVIKCTYNIPISQKIKIFRKPPIFEWINNRVTAVI
jgi:hypothetical protein